MQNSWQPNRNFYILSSTHLHERPLWHFTLIYSTSVFVLHNHLFDSYTTQNSNMCILAHLSIGALWFLSFTVACIKHSKTTFTFNILKHPMIQIKYTIHTPNTKFKKKKKFETHWIVIRGSDMMSTLNVWHWNAEQQTQFTTLWKLLCNMAYAKLNQFNSFLNSTEDWIFQLPIWLWILY